MQYILTLCFCVLLAGQFSRVSAGEDFLAGAKRVLVLGDSITYSGEYVEYVAGYFATRFPGREVEFMNVGLPSETVSGLSEEGHAGGAFPRPDLHERLGRVLTQTKPDVVLACYGMNDGIYLPFSEERFGAFTNGIVWMRDSVLKVGAKIILVTPPVFDEKRGKGPGYSAVLDRYSDWLVGQRKMGWEVVDVHGPMDHYLKERRKVDPDFYLAGDGVHAGAVGHWIMAKGILEFMGAKDLEGVGSGAEMMKGYRNGAEVLKLVEQEQRMMKDAWLTATGHKRPGMNKGLPLGEAEKKRAALEEKIKTLAMAGKKD